jgi:hypothetical protein
VKRAVEASSLADLLAVCEVESCGEKASLAKVCLSCGASAPVCPEHVVGRATGRKMIGTTTCCYSDGAHAGLFTYVRLRVR